MNRGMYDDEPHEVPGHGPTVILAHDDEGDAAAVPHEVEAALRHSPRMTKLEALDAFEVDLKGSADKLGCLRDWQKSYSHLSTELSRLYQDRMIEACMRGSTGVIRPLFKNTPPPDADEAQPSPRLVHSGEPVLAPPAGRPTVVALVVCVMALLAVESLLVALRVGGAITWDWGWVLVPVWVPVSIATVLTTVIALGLAALDERDAARRRRA